MTGDIYRRNIDVEALGKPICAAFLKSRAENIEVTPTPFGKEKSPQRRARHRAIQDTCADFLVRRPCKDEPLCDFEMFRIEDKTEEKSGWTGNLFLETVRGRSAGPGWFLASPAEYVVYMFLDIQLLYYFALPILREWLLVEIDEERSTADHNKKRPRASDLPPMRWNPRTGAWGLEIPCTMLMECPMVECYKWVAEGGGEYSFRPIEHPIQFHTTEDKRGDTYWPTPSDWSGKTRVLPR